MDSMVTLHKGYFWSAGRLYGWAESDPGVGIALKKIKQALPDGRIYVKSKYDHLSIAAKTAMEFIKAHKSIYIIGRTKLGVIAKSKFKTKEE